MLLPKFNPFLWGNPARYRLFHFCFLLELSCDRYMWNRARLELGGYIAGTDSIGSILPHYSRVCSGETMKARDLNGEYIYINSND